MMPGRARRAFTLIEVLTAVAVIAILAFLVIIAGSYCFERIEVVKRDAGEIAGMSAACEQYKNDNGHVPHSSKTDLLDPRVHGNPAGGDDRKKYQDACLELYSALSGDYEPANHPDFRPEPGRKMYYEFKPNNLSYKKTAEHQIEAINYIQDPWGNCYGYSTARAKAERDFQERLREHPEAIRPANMPGYNPLFDMWSTAGVTRNRPRNGEQDDSKKWTKNW